MAFAIGSQPADAVSASLSNREKLRGNLKSARIVELEDGDFSLEYDNNLGNQNSMRLDAASYESALREAKFFLNINQQSIDPDGTTWEIE
jgi:hypothetical protein